MDWLWWVGGAIAFALVEILSLDLVLVMFAGGALSAAAVNAAGGPLWLQIVVFAVVSALLLLTLRPWLLRHLRTRVPLTETGAAAQVGRTAQVVATVSATEGRVKLVGEVWSARAADATAVLPVGADVVVVRIDGATAVVQPMPAGGTPGPVADRPAGHPTTP